MKETRVVKKMKKAKKIKAKEKEIDTEIPLEKLEESATSSDEDETAKESISEPNFDENPSSSDEDEENLTKIKLSNDPEADDKPQEPQEAETPPKKPKSDPNKTIFVGNLPVVTKPKHLHRFFKPFGNIASLRFRSEDGRKVLNKSDRKKCSTLNAYIVFETEKQAKAALAKNGERFRENVIRVNPATSRQSTFSDSIHSKSTIFVGNLSFEATENEIHEHFESRCGEVEYVRRIPNKGIAYVCFKKGVPLVKALKMNGEEFQGRPMRVQKWVPKHRLEKKERMRPQKGKKAAAMGQGRQKVDATRPSNNPLVKKLREKTGVAEQGREEFKRRFKGGMQAERQVDKPRKKSEFTGVKSKHGKVAKKKEKIKAEKKKLIKTLNASLVGAEKKKKK